MELLEKEYVSLCSDRGANLALALSNALILAERAESCHEWMMGSDATGRAKSKARLEAWVNVAQRRTELDDFLYNELGPLAKELRQAGAQEYEADFVLRAGIATTIGRGQSSREEVLAMLGAWAAPILLKPSTS